MIVRMIFSIIDRRAAVAVPTPLTRVFLKFGSDLMGRVVVAIDVRWDGAHNALRPSGSP